MIKKNTGNFNVSAFGLRKNILTLILSVFVCISINAQTYYFDKYDVRDGLPQSKVYCTVQDKGGFLWVGTTIGISKFDGKTFQNYSTENGLAENGVKSILIDSRGVFWMGHIGGGLTRYKGSKFEKINIKEISHDITSIVEDEKGDIWISTVGDGVIRIENPGEIKTNKLVYKQFRGKETISDFVFAICRRQNNSLFFITDLGLKTYNPVKNTFDFFRPDQMPGYFQITCMYEDVNLNLWFGTYNGGLYKYEEKKGFIKIYDVVRDGLALNWISTIKGDHLKNIWIGTWGGGITVIKNDKVIENFNQKNGLFDNKIWCIEEDREGNIILGTNENGLLIYKGKKFTSFSKSDGLVNDQVWAISQDSRGRMWFGTNEGITVFSPDTRKYESFTLENSKLISKQIRFLKKDKNGNIWIGTNDYGIQQYDVNQNKFYYDRLINQYFPSSNSLVSALEVDKDNNLWIGTTEWLVYYEIDKNKITTLSQGNGLAGNDISVIYCDSRNVLWVGSKRKGLTRIEGEKITRVDLKENFTPKCISEDKDGKLWIGTEDRGIIVLKDSKIVKRFKITNGLLSNNILALNVDEDNNIFIGTSAGLNKFNQKTNKFFDYTVKSGFTGIEVKDHATYKDRENDLWFGTINGAIKYTRKYDIHNLLEPVTFISRFRVNLIDREMEEGIKLNYLDKSITFDFGSICLSNAQDVKYLYRLIGADKDWKPLLNDQTSVTYFPLPPGKYTFQVKASNNEGTWNKKPVTFSFRIEPPFWKTWWFYTIMILIIIAALVLFIKMRERKHISEKNKLEKKVKQRTTEVVKEKEKTEALLLNTLPVKVVNELKLHGKSKPESFDNVTVCFTDICNFTDISAEFDPDIIIRELNDIFTAFDDIVVRHKSERIKTIGDSYLSVCGLPEEDENHALNIARAALEMCKYIEERAKTQAIKWRVRIGMDSGKVTGGIVGVRKYLYDIFGDAVNTASRMESNSEPMRINCSEATYLILKDKFRFTERETIIVKGKGKMKMYFIEEELL